MAAMESHESGMRLPLVPHPVRGGLKVAERGSGLMKAMVQKDILVICPLPNIDMPST